MGDDALNGEVSSTNLNRATFFFGWGRKINMLFLEKKSFVSHVFESVEQNVKKVPAQFKIKKVFNFINLVAPYTGVRGCG